MATFTSVAIASSTRIIDADSLRSADHTKSYSLPGSSGTLLNANSITPGTNLKITYGANGLITSGTTAAITDLSNVVVSTPTTGQVLQYNGSNWVNASVQQAMTATQETPSGSVNGSNTSFSCAHTPISGSFLLWINGLLQTQGSGKDYTLSGTTITVATPPATGQTIWAHYWY